MDEKDNDMKKERFPEPAAMLRRNIKLKKSGNKNKQAGEASTSPEDLYRTIFEKTGTATVILEEDDTIALANGGFEKLVGYTREEIAGRKKWTEFIHRKDDLERMKKIQRLRRVDPLSVPDTYEFQLVDRKKRAKDILVTITSMPDKKQTLVTLLDIGEHRRMEEALKSERRLADIVDFLPDATFAIDLSGKIIAWNHAIERTSGVKAENMLGKGDHEYAVPFYGIQRPMLIDLVLKFNKELEKKYNFVQRKENVFVAEAEVTVRGRHHVVWVKAGPLYDSHGNVIGAIESVRDITEFKQAEKAKQKIHDKLEIMVRERTAELVEMNDALQNEIFERKQTEAVLKENEKKFAAIFYKSAIPMAITAIKDGLYIDVNESFMKVMGLKYEELVGNSSTGAGYISDESRELFLEEFQQKGFVANLELEIRVKNGESRRGLFNSSKITIGSEDFFLTTVTDVTELRRVEKELRKYHEELEVMVVERTRELEGKTKNLQEINTTLNVLLEKRIEDKKIWEENFVANISSLVLPYVERIRKNNLDVQQQFCLNTIEKNLGNVVSPLLKNIQQFDMTPREVQIVSLIKDGRTTKEIAKTLGIGEGSIDTHRKNIRKKLGLDRASNLQSHLRFLEE